VIIIALIIINGVKAIVELDIINKECFTSSRKYNIYPNNELALRTLFIIVDSTYPLSFSFALSFVLIFGTVLIELHEQFKQDFSTLLSCFSIYSRLTGIFSVAIIFQTTIVTIRTVSLLSIPQLTRSFQETDGYLNGTASIAALVILACFGSFLENKVKSRCRLIATSFAICNSPHDFRVKKIMKWILASKWKITAFNFSKINRGLIVAVAQTAFTYFIFMFQLRSSESLHLNKFNIS
ncbi:unnamed protein product, partial [Allacma fusca]